MYNSANIMPFANNYIKKTEVSLLSKPAGLVQVFRSCLINEPSILLTRKMGLVKWA